MNGLCLSSHVLNTFGGDLHAADALYHHICAINFRTGKGGLANFSDASQSKRKKAGRPKDTDQEQAFERMCLFFEENDEEGFTISQLSEKMNEYLEDQTSTCYGNSYLKSQLLKRYGDSLYRVSQKKGNPTLARYCACISS